MVLLVVAVAVLSLALGPSHLVRMVRFTNAFNNVSGGLGGKLHGAVLGFQAHPRFAAICMAALVVAGARCFVRPRCAFLPEIAVAALIVSVAACEVPVFYSRSHDLVILLALTGCCTAVRCLVSRDADRDMRVLAILYAVSLIAGLATAATAFNGLFNFPIGGCLAACISLGMPVLSSLSHDAEARRSGVYTRYAVMVLACIALAMTTFTSYYGQIGGFAYRTSVRIWHGAFAGLRTDPEQASFIAQMTLELKTLASCGTRFAVFGTGPGFYLMTTMAPTTLSTWNLAGNVRNAAAEAFESFYGVRAQQTGRSCRQHLAMGDAAFGLRADTPR